MDQVRLTNEVVFVRRSFDPDTKIRRLICFSITIFFVLGFISGLVYLGVRSKGNHQTSTTTPDYGLWKNDDKTDKTDKTHDTDWNVMPENNLTISGPQWLQRMEKKMNLGYKPCEKFYERSCKSWELSTTLVDGEGYSGEFLIAAKEVYREIRSQLEKGKLMGNAEQKAKTYFESCMRINRGNDRSRILERFKTIRMLMRYQDIQSLLTFVHSRGAWPLFRIDVRPDPRNVAQHKLTLTLGTWPFKNLHEKIRNKKINTPIIQKAKEDAEGIGDIAHSIKMDQDTDKNASKIVMELKALLGTGEPSEYRRRKRHITGNNEELSDSTLERMLKTHNKENELIYKYIFGLSDSAPISDDSSFMCSFYGTCESQKSEAKKAADNLLKTEVGIVKAMKKVNVTEYGSKAFDILTQQELQLSCPMIDWKRYLKSLSNGGVRPVDEIVVMGKENLFSMCKYVREQTNSRYMKDYLLIALFKSLFGYFDIGLLYDNELWTEHSKDDQFRQNHWWRCLAYTQEALDMATSSVFVRNSPSRDSVGQVQEILDYVKKAFRTKTLRKSWMDRATEAAALKKLDSMLDKVGYPSYIMKQTYRDKYYQQLNVSTDYYDNVLNSKQFVIREKCQLLRKPATRTKWSLAASEVNAVHTMTVNDMTVPLAIMRPPFFDPDRPIGLNFGSLGAIIGHELTHAFGTTGQYFDFEGARNDWMSRSAEEALTKKSKCFVDQYDRYTIGGEEISANLTLEENIADNGGFRTAYNAYYLWKQDNGEDIAANVTSFYNKNGFTQEKLFFIAFSQMYCSKFSDTSLKALVSENHSPGPLRVKGTLSNMAEFSKVFDCPSYSTYNPWTKCVLW